MKRKDNRNRRKNNEIRLYCQCCCARYSYCLWENTLHSSYDTCAETCPDYLPNDIYKAVNPKTLNITNSKSSSYRKRLKIDPDFNPLPENIPLSFWTKEQLENIKECASKKIEKFQIEEQNKKMLVKVICGEL